MSRRRRAALLLGLALVLGGLAASDVSRREEALRSQLAPLVDVLVARRELEAGRRLRPGDLAVRSVPERFAPPGGPAVPELLLGRRLAVPVLAGGAVSPLLLEQPAPTPAAAVRRGERAVEVVAAAAPGTVQTGARVDVLVTRERGGTELALQDVAVLATRPAPDTEAPRDAAGALVAATLRVPLQDAVRLTAAGALAREVRLLARAAGDRRRVSPLAIGP
jgi:pilus assembly protein CpaB